MKYVADYNHFCLFSNSKYITLLVILFSFCEKIISACGSYSFFKIFPTMLSRLKWICNEVSQTFCS